MYLINDSLSEPLYRAICKWKDSYSRTGYLSTTSCIDSPRIRVLEKRYDDRIQVPATSFLSAFIGTAVHSAIDGADPEAIHEEELTTEVHGILFSGRPDIIHFTDQLELGDFKTTSVGAYIFSGPKGKASWERQANINSWLARKNGHNVTRAWVELIFTDWKKGDAKYDKLYPQSPVMRLYPDLLRDEEVQTYVEGRVALHLEADSKSDDELPFCTCEEMWAREDAWAVIKDGGTRAVKGGVHNSLESAKKHIRQTGGGHHIEERKGKRVRCEDYCTVQRFCNQYRDSSAR